MAVVYKAQDLALGRLVAVKILREPHTNDPDFLARFQQEARAAANLAHPNIVTVHDFGRDGGRNYIVMEYIEGKDLKTLIKEGSPFKPDRALDIAIQICAGIGYAHRAGLVHCDVKPQNILVTPDGRVKVTDFGIAKAMASIQPGETTDVVWGSPQYYSPEQAAGEAPTPASDVYSIGIVMYEMLAGRLPFVASTQQALAMMHLRDEPPRLTLFNPNLPEVYAYYGQALLRTGEPVRASDAFRKALAANPNDYQANMQLAVLLKEEATSVVAACIADPRRGYWGPLSTGNH